MCFRKVQNWFPVFKLKTKDFLQVFENTAGGGWRRVWSENSVTPEKIELSRDVIFPRSISHYQSISYHPGLTIVLESSLYLNGGFEVDCSCRHCFTFGV